MGATVMPLLGDPALTEALSRCVAPAETALSLPPACYTDDVIAAAEIDAIFRSGWLGVGRVDQVAAPGDYVTRDIAGQSIILLRDREGRLRAFANSCRHRGARLLDGDGNCRGIRCPFHSWAYKLDGSLAAAPHMDAAPDFTRENFGLVAYRAEERLGFAFICLDPSTPDLDTVLDGFAEIHASWPMDTLVTTRRRSLTVGCNWKAFIEVFNEYYHLPFVHPDSVDQIYLQPERADNVVGAFATQFGPTEGTGGVLQTEQEKALPSISGLTGREAAGVRYTWAYPNMTFAMGTDALWVYEAYPLGASECLVFQTACFPPETVALPGFDKRVGAYHDRLDAALAEDIPALENQQRGFACPDARQGRFEPLLESNVASFARWYAARMTCATL